MLRCRVPGSPANTEDSPYHQNGGFNRGGLCHRCGRGGEAWAGDGRGDRWAAEWRGGWTTDGRGRGPHSDVREGFAPRMEEAGWSQLGRLRLRGQNLIPRPCRGVAGRALSAPAPPTAWPDGRFTEGVAVRAAWETPLAPPWLPGLRRWSVGLSPLGRQRAPRHTPLSRTHDRNPTNFQVKIRVLALCLSFLNRPLTFWLRLQGQRKLNSSRRNLDLLGPGRSSTASGPSLFCMSNFLTWSRALRWGLGILESPPRAEWVFGSRT